MVAFGSSDDLVVVIIGSGTSGGMLTNKLCQKGIKIVVLEAGGKQSSVSFINDKWKVFSQLAWFDKCMTSGSRRIAKGLVEPPVWVCKAVGGTSTHWADAPLHFQEREFQTRTLYDGLKGASLLGWLLILKELEPYYVKVEDKMGVTRTDGIPSLPDSNNLKVMYNGATRPSYKEVYTGNVAINNKPHKGCARCMQLSFCFEGCKSGAEWSTLYTGSPEADATGNFELHTQAHVTCIKHDGKRRVNVVAHMDKGSKEQWQKTHIVCVAGNSIETPRLLLLSASNMFRDGLVNSSGQVDRNYIRHMIGSVYAAFKGPIHMYRGTTMAGIVCNEARHDIRRGFVGGYELETLSLGIPFVAVFPNSEGWGSGFARWTDHYTGLVDMWLVGEDMPRETNRATLNANIKGQRDDYVLNMHFGDHENDIAMRRYAYTQAECIYGAVGVIKTSRTPPYLSTHNLGTARMSARPQDGICNKWGQIHDITNPFISDGS